MESSPSPRVLIVAHRTATTAALHAAVRERAARGPATFALLVPATAVHVVPDDVPAARDAVLAAGGRAIGEVVTLVNAAGKALTWVYVTDPEGNVIELQSRPR